MKKVLFSVLLIASAVCSADVFINEMMSSNGAELAWVELRNTGDSAVDVSSWRIAKESKKWKNWTQLPADSVIPAGGYLVVYLDPALDAVTSAVIGGEIHVGLDGYEIGDTLAIAHDFQGGDKNKPADVEGAIASRLDFNGTPQYDGVSYGVSPTDPTQWLYFETATPGAANGNDGVATYNPTAFPTVTFEGFDRPRLGSSLSVALEGAGSDKCVCEWTRTDFTLTNALQTIATSKTYEPVTADLEHWLQVVVSKNGQGFATNRVWVSRLPVVYINTDDGEPVVIKDEYKSASMIIQGNEAYKQQYAGNVEIKGRGNTSWGYPQKPYKLKLESKTNIFGFGKNKHWVLLSNFVDRSMLRNEAGSALAKELGIIGMDMTSVVVILNGEYNGVYEFGEHLRVDADRVDIFNWDAEAESVADALYDAVKDVDGLTKSDKSALESQMDEDFSWVTSGEVFYNQNTHHLADYDLKKDYDLTGGYLFELSAQYDEFSRFKTSNGLMVMVNTPEFLMTDVSMASAVTNLWNSFEESCKAYNGYNSCGRHFTEIADLDSMAAFWLVNEVLDNSDCHWNSRYAYKDVGGDKLHFGPVWDFDCGGGSFTTWQAPENIWRVTSRVITDSELSGQNFFRDWVGHPEFCARAYELWHSKVRPWLSAFVSDGGTIDVESSFRAEAGIAHDAKWKDAECTIWGENYDRRSVAEDVAIYKNFLRKRLAWLDQQFASYETLVSSLKDVSNNPHSGLNFNVEYDLDGGSAGALKPTNGKYNEWFTVSDPVKSGYVFAGWQFGEGFSPATAQYTVQEGVAVNITNVNRVVLPPHGWVGFRNVTTESRIRMKAIWAQSSYRVSYRLNGGKSGALSPTSVGFFDWLTVTDPVRKGYSFLGWRVVGGLSASTAEWRSDVVDPLPLTSQTDSPLPTPFGWIGFRYLSTGDAVTLSAEWTAVQYAVDYVLGEGGKAGSLAPTSSDYSRWLTIKNPTRSGYRFLGWKISGEGIDVSNAEYRDNAGTPQKFSLAPDVIRPSNGWLGLRYLSNGGTVVFTAQWLPLEYAVSYDLDGGIAGALAPTKGSYYGWLTVKDPSKSGYTFAGWRVLSGLDLGNAEYRGDVIEPIKFTDGNELIETPYHWAGFRYLCNTGFVVLRAVWLPKVQLRVSCVGNSIGQAGEGNDFIAGTTESGCAFYLLMPKDGQDAYLYVSCPNGESLSGEVEMSEISNESYVIESEGWLGIRLLIKTNAGWQLLSRSL